MRNIVLTLLIFTSFASLAEHIGLSAHEMQLRSNYLTAELVNKISIDEGLAIQARVTHFSGKKFNIDSGYAFHSGDREHRVFLGGAYEIFPDHKSQPRISLKAHLELVGLASDFDFLAGITPIASKGISVSDYIMYPFIGIPIRKVFDRNADTEMGFTMGTTLELQKNLMLSIEGTLNLRNMPSSLLIGISTNI